MSWCTDKKRKRQRTLVCVLWLVVAFLIGVLFVMAVFGVTSHCQLSSLERLDKMYAGQCGQNVKKYLEALVPQCRRNWDSAQCQQILSAQTAACSGLNAVRQQQQAVLSQVSKLLQAGR